MYQGRFKSFPIQEDGHFLAACRYVEPNAVRAELVQRAEAWRWGSLWRWGQKAEPVPRLLSPWPIRRSPNWVERNHWLIIVDACFGIRRRKSDGPFRTNTPRVRVNEPLTKGELDTIRRSAQHSLIDLSGESADRRQRSEKPFRTNTLGVRNVEVHSASAHGLNRRRSGWASPPPSAPVADRKFASATNRKTMTPDPFDFPLVLCHS